MKNNNRIISFLKLFFQLAYKLAIFGFVLVAIAHTISFFSGEDFVGIPFKGNVILNLNASYSLILEGAMNQEISLGVSHIVVESGSVFAHIYSILDLLIRGLILIFLFYNAYKSGFFFYLFNFIFCPTTISVPIPIWLYLYNFLSLMPYSCEISRIVSPVFTI